MEELKSIGFVNKTIIEKWISECKNRIKKELDRDIIIEVPFLKHATNSDWIKSNYNFLWLHNSFIQIQPKEEDKELYDLFNIPPIEDNPHV